MRRIPLLKSGHDFHSQIFLTTTNIAIGGWMTHWGIRSDSDVNVRAIQSTQFHFHTERWAPAQAQGYRCTSIHLMLCILISSNDRRPKIPQGHNFWSRHRLAQIACTSSLWTDNSSQSILSKQQYTANASAYMKPTSKSFAANLVQACKSAGSYTCLSYI